MIRSFAVLIFAPLAAAGALKALAGLSAWSTLQEPLEAVNYAGVPRWCQLLALVALLAAAAAIAGLNPVRLAWCATWALGASAFGRVALREAGWWDPPLERALAVVVPLTILLSIAVARRRPLAGTRRGLILASAACLLGVALLPLAELRVVPVWLQAVFFATLAAGALASAAALRRLHADNVTG